MSSVVKFNNKVLRLNDKDIGFSRNVYTITTAGNNGIIIASPNSGYNGTIITLSNTPNDGYEFVDYAITGSTIYNTNKFNINNSDVIVSGKFKVIPYPLESITIGNQIWSKNIKINDGGSGIIIKNNVSANGVNFGTQYYYTTGAAQRIADSLPGWHIPSTLAWSPATADVEILRNYVGTSTGGKKLKSTTGWHTNGTDVYGFKGEPIGYLDSNGTFNNLGYDAVWWGSLNGRISQSYGYYLNDGDKLNISNSLSTSHYYMPLKLIQDT